MKSPLPTILQTACSRAASVAVLACLGLFVAAIFAPQQAHAANDTAACTVRIIHAKHEGAKFDERLKPLEDRLKKPPLSAWKSFSLVQEHALTLREKTPSTFPVPGDHQGQLELLGTVEGHGMKRLRLRWQILDGAARLLSTVFVIDDGGTLLQAGIKHDNGLLVMGLTCKLGS